MCGIFGYISKSPPLARLDDVKVIKKLFTLSESRGKEAAGMLAMTGENIDFLRDATSASKLIKRKDFNSLLDDTVAKNGLVAVFGHSRLVTNGVSTNQENNQPVYSGKILGVHNGIIVNEAELWSANRKLVKKTEVDTEVLLQLIKNNLKSDGLVKSLVKAYEQIEGVANIGLMFEEFDIGLLATNNGSLYYVVSKDECTLLFASERHILAEAILKTEMSFQFCINDICQLKPRSFLLIDFCNLEFSSHYFSEFKSVKIKVRKKRRQVSDISKNVQSKSVIYRDLPIIEPANRALIEVAYVENRERVNKLVRCSKCILPETMPFIEFDLNGVCNYCNNYVKRKVKGISELKKIFSKKLGQYDCLVTLSGGRDSSFGLHFVKNQLGLNVASYTYDWGMVTDLARRNQMRMCGALGVEHILVSADLHKKRANIRKNVSAWLEQPELGMIPLFMAGDKQYFYWSNKIAQQLNVSNILLCENMLETTYFKTGFCGIEPVFANKNTYTLSFSKKIRLIFYYLKNFIKNPKYINYSLLDTLNAFSSYYVMNHNFINLFDYIEWDERAIDGVLAKKYNWEKASDAKSTWRIGDGTAAFYNYIYYTMAGVTENDTFRSNQVREGAITRDQALTLSFSENEPRIDSIEWYLETIGLDFDGTIKIINNAKKLY